MLSRRTARWVGFGPKVNIISNLIENAYSVHMVATEDDEIRILGARARDCAISVSGRSGEAVIFTTSSDRMASRIRWDFAISQLLVNPGLWYTRGAIWCIFVRPITGSTATARILRHIDRQFKLHDFTSTAGNIDEVIAIVSSNDTESATVTPEPREICAD